MELSTMRRASSITWNEQHQNWGVHVMVNNASWCELLNQWDGGKRTIFKDRDEWIKRLIETGKIKINLATS